MSAPGLPDPDLLEAAAERLLRAEQAADPTADAALHAWLAEDPGRRAAFDAVAETDHLMALYAEEAQMAELRRGALRARPARALARWAGLAAGLSVLAVGGWAAWQASGFAPHVFDLPGVEQTRTALYRTAADERTTVALADGSVIALNADTLVETTYDRRSRTARLLRGQALFSVAHDPSRPFDVLAEGRRVTAVGTEFDVLVLPDGVRVAMLDGAVRVSGDRPGPEQTLSAGEVMIAPREGPVVVRKADAKRLAGWREGVVYFEETPLSEAVVEMNRYARNRIVVADARAGALRVSGAFRIAEADAFAQAMTEIFPLSLKRSGDGRAVLSSTKP
ncbi:FecR family protein [Brevundimonas faecalis]|uniref:Transmembrane sensor n=1 Tax=Brevundimonas faecalis TaxID=947378 RepID=A0ABV2R721_9CAUL